MYLNSLKIEFIIIKEPDNAELPVATIDRASNYKDYPDSCDAVH